MNDTFWFAVLPYVSLTVFFVVTIARYRTRAFSYSSLSSQFLENRQHFWGSVPFHYGILTVLAGHLAAVFFPRAILGWNADPLRVAILEVTGFAFAILTLVGLVNVVLRRLRFSKARRVTTWGDWFIYQGALWGGICEVWTPVCAYESWWNSWVSDPLTCVLGVLLIWTLLDRRKS